MACCPAVAQTARPVGDAAAASDSRSFAIRAKAVYPVTSEQFGPIENGVVIVRDGRIEAVGADLDIPSDLRVIDLRDETIVPAYVDAASSLAGSHTGLETVSGAYSPLDAFDPYGDHRETLARGTVTVHLDPGGHRLVSGHGAVVKLAGDPERAMLRPDADIAMNLGVYDPPNLWDVTLYASADDAIEPAKRQRPDSRLGQYLELYERIANAPYLMDRLKRPLLKGGEYDYHALAFARLWTAGTPLRIQGREAADIEGALSLLRRTDRKGYLVGVGEGDKLRRALLEAGAPVVLRMEQSYDQPGQDIGGDPAAYAPRLRTAGRIRSSKVALSGREGDRDADLGVVAALAMHGGMDPRTALEGVTRVAAEVLGVEDRVGSLAVGKDADFLVLSGPPLGVSSHVLRTYAGGREVFRAPEPKTMVVKAGTIWIGNGRVLHDGAILVENGRIQAIDHRVAHPPFAKVIDAGAQGFISPGFIDGHGHLGLENDRTPASADLSLADTVGVAGEEFLRVARAGVTTVMLAAYRVASNGSRVAAIKTWGRDRDDMVVRPVSAMKFSLRNGDPQLGRNGIKSVIEAGKQYQEKWTKYEEELKKWEDEQAKGGSAEKAKTPAVEEKVTESKPDRVSGSWSFILSGGPLPENVTGTMRLQLTGDRIRGRLSSEMAGDEEAEVSGTLEGDKIVLEIEQDTPVGKPRLEATLDREDHMSGAVVIAQFSLNFEATRTDKARPEFEVSRRRKRGKGGRPLPPKVDENLEPVRAMLAQSAPALVDVENAAEIRAVVKLFGELKLPLVLLNAEEAFAVADELKAAKVGVVAPPRMMRTRDRVSYNQAADLSRRGVSVALQSDAEDAARNLPLMALFGVRQGLGGDAALRALTLDAAKMFKIEDRVGSLEAGKDADILIFSGHPFDADSRLQRVIISGREVPDE
jgi:imidazolonepropionase-like amidohydrolase